MTYNMAKLIRQSTKKTLAMKNKCTHTQDMAKIETVKDLVDLWGSDDSAAEAWGTNAAVVQKMRLGNRLPGWHLMPIWRAAQSRRFKQVTALRLIEMAEKRA